MIIPFIPNLMNVSIKNENVTIIFHVYCSVEIFLLILETFVIYASSVLLLAYFHSFFMHPTLLFILSSFLFINKMNILVSLAFIYINDSCCTKLNCFLMDYLLFVTSEFNNKTVLSWQRFSYLFPLPIHLPKSFTSLCFSFFMHYKWDQV